MESSETAASQEAAGAAGKGSQARERGEKAWIVRSPELWLIVALAAVLRLWHIGVSLFLADQAELMRMARLSLRDGLIPVTGIPSSIGTLNPPASVFALLPFAALGSDPLPAVIGVAMWNVLGVALAYIFARRFFNRRVATVTALLFAVGGAAVWYSRFIWQQNLLPPIVLLWAICAFGGATRDQGRRIWLAPAVGCALLAVQMHPTAIIFLPITLVAALLAPRSPRKLDWLLTAAVVVALLLPTLIFEKLSSGYDLRQLTIYAGQGSHIDLSVGRALWGILDGPDTHNLSTHGLAHELTSPTGLVTLILAALIAAGYALLTMRVIRPAWRVWRAERTAATGMRRLSATARSLWRGLRSDPTWKVNLLLWLWLTVPILALIRHSSLVADHYLITLYPAIFIPAALIAARAFRIPPLPVGAWGWGQQPTPLPLARGRGRGMRTPQGWKGKVISLLGLALVALLVVAQSARDLGYYSRQLPGGVNQFAIYGYPLDEMRTLNQRLDALARQTRASSVEIVDPRDSPDPKIVEYLLADGRADRLSFGGDCLILPAPSAAPVLIAASPTGQPAGDFLAGLPGASHLADIPMPGTDAWRVYQYVRPSPVLALPGDHAVAQATFRDGANDDIRLDAVARDGGMLRLRWTALSVTNPPYGAQLGFSVTVSLGGAEAQGGCQTQRWQAGQTFLTWLPLPATGATSSDAITLRVADQTLGPIVLPFAGLHLLTGSYFHHSARGLFAQPSSDSGLVQPGSFQPDGSYSLPLSAFGVG